MNAVYANLRLLQDLFLPSVKLQRKERLGARLRRTYDAPHTPLDRVRACPQADAAKVAALVRQRATLDPFVLAARVDDQLAQLYTLANHQRGLVPAAGAAADTFELRGSYTRSRLACGEGPIRASTIDRNALTRPAP